MPHARVLCLCCLFCISLINVVSLSVIFSKPFLFVRKEYNSTTNTKILFAILLNFAPCFDIYLREQTYEFSKRSKIVCTSHRSSIAIFCYVYLAISLVAVCIGEAIDPSWWHEVRSE